MGDASKVVEDIKTVFTNPSKLLKDAEKSLKKNLGLRRKDPLRKIISGDTEELIDTTEDGEIADVGEDITETLSAFDADAAERARIIARRLREAARIGPGKAAQIATSPLGVTKAAKRLRTTLG
jgi:hypothetical protein